MKQLTKSLKMRIFLITIMIYNTLEVELGSFNLSTLVTSIYRKPAEVVDSDTCNLCLGEGKVMSVGA